jgi:dipeptidyl aminopeptidase/acylaminoacyl peptidase
MRSILASLALAVLLVAVPVHTDSRRFDLDDLSRVVRISDPQFASDGHSIVAVVSHANLDEDRWDAELASIDVGSGVSTPKMLTSGHKGVSSPRVSPDGSKIAFLMMDGPAKDAHLQLFTMGTSGGDPKEVTTAPTGVQQFAWSPDGKTIAFASADELEKKPGPERFNDSFEIVNDDFTVSAAILPTHLWIVGSDGGSMKRLTSGAWSLPTSHPPGPPASPIVWSPDSKSIIFTQRPSPHSGGGQQQSLQVINVADGSIKPLGPRGSSPIFSPDGNTIAYTGTAPGPVTPGQPQGGNNEISVFTPGSTAKTLTMAIDRNMARALWFPDGKSLLVGANDSTRVSLWMQPLDGGAKKIDLGDVSPNSSFWVDMAVGPKGEIAFTGSTSTRPSELYYKPSPDAPVQRLTDLNKDIASLQLGRTDVIEWTNDQFPENGLLTYPPDFDPSKKYPLVLVIHGGPRAASLMGFGTQAQLMAAHGWLVFQPNYRGSDNLGAAYQRAIRNDAGEGPGRDVWAGMDVVKKRGIVDESRVAVSGWSYGGYMTTWMIGHFQGWKAAVAGAAVTDQLDQYNLGDGNGGRGNGSPWVDPKAMERMHEQSPISYVKNMKTPTLILTDMADYRVPPMQSFKLYHALVDNGVTVKFVGYPVNGHSPTDPVRQRDVQRRWTGWLSDYLDKPVNTPQTR